METGTGKRLIAKGFAVAMIEVKQAVKKEFNARKKVEEGLRLTHVYEDVAKRAGYRDWNEYSAVLNSK